MQLKNAITLRPRLHEYVLRGNESKCWIVYTFPFSNSYITDIIFVAIETQTVLLSIFFLTTTTNSARTVNVFLVYTKSTQLRFSKSSLW